MDLNVGDKVRVLKEVYDKSRTIKVGTVLEITWSKSGVRDHIRRCVDNRGRTLYVHVQDALDGCFEKIYSAPVLPATTEFVRSFRKPRSTAEQSLLAQVRELKDSQNLLAARHAQQISVILVEKEKLEKELAEAKKWMGEFGMRNVDKTAKLAQLRGSMRKWLLQIQFSSQHTEMRKELQGYIKLLDKERTP